MKKLLAIVLSLCLLLVFAGCGDAATTSSGAKEEAKVLSIDEVELTKADTIKAVAKEDLKIGFIFLHDQNSTYDKNFIDAANAACKDLGIKDEQVIMKTGIPEGEECYTTAKELVTAGCQVIFADSFGHEPYMVKAAKEFPNVQFCHATGVRGKTELLGNYHTAFAEIYKGRYLAGIAAGMKLNEMIKAGQFKA
ncbi:MAG: BMP family ABC transporter substrate-binding protein, partial [Clostridia bacterium]|nr:BMP family ABC transporter substrate-binding protein [Clostridia bacterium]